MGNKSLKDASIVAARKTGLLPHEWLLLVMRGAAIAQTHVVTCEDGRKLLENEDYYPTFEQRVDAAKACASYFSARLATQSVKIQGDPEQPLQLSLADALSKIQKDLADEARC